MVKSPGFNIILFILLFPALHGQEEVFTKRVNIDVHQQSIYHTLLTIEKQTGYFFSYNSEIINEDKLVTLSLQDFPLHRTLDKLLNDTTLRFKVIDDQIIIFRENLPDDNSTIQPEKDKKITVQGSVTDAATLAKIPYATISIEGQNLGTVTNSQGEFKIIIPENFQDQNLVFSYLGYKTLRLKINEIIDRKTFRLSPSFIPIPEVIIRLNQPVSILTQALEKIPENYFSQPAIMDGFYRETIKKNNKYTAVSEALINIHKSSYNDPRNDQVKIMKGRKYYETNRNDTITFKLKAGLQNITYLDIIKTHPNFFYPQFLPYYQFSMENIIIMDDEPAYNIAFSPRQKTEEPLYEGNIYIDIRTLAIKRAEFSVNTKSLSKITNMLVQKKPRGYKVNALGAEYLVNYNQVNEKHYIGYLQSNVKFRVRERKKIFGNTFTLTSETAITNLDTVNVKRFKSREISRSGEVFETQIPDYNAMYWNNFNIIQPEQPLVKAIERLTETLKEENL